MLGESLKVALVGEGTYPYHAGGVSLWCHQLVQGMPDYSFTAVALTVDGTERPTWTMLDNLAEVANIPLWGRAPRPQVRTGRLIRRRRDRDDSFPEIHRRFLSALFGQAPDNADAVLAALRELFEYGQSNDLSAALTTNTSIERLQAAWNDAGLDGPDTTLTLRDALIAADRIEHMLRPLSHPPVQVDVCHLAMNGLCALVAMASKWAYGTPIVLSEHGVYLRERYLGVAGEGASYQVRVIMLRFFRALAVAAYRIADILTPHSGYNRRWMIQNGADPARIRTMYNGINPADFPAVTEEPDVPTIVFVGRIDPLKDLQTLIKAFAIVRQSVPDARLRMFGPVSAVNREYHASCVRLIEELGLTDAAAFEGRIPNQVDAYKAGHLVALTSVSEGFPYTVVESMSTGRPQVCTNVGGVSEAVGDAGFVVTPRDHHAVADACIRLLADTELRRRLGDLARSRVMEWFTLDQWTDAYQGLYRDLGGSALPASPPPPAADGSLSGADEALPELEVAV